MIWRDIQKRNFTSLIKLLDFLEIEQESRSYFAQIDSFVLNLPIRLAQKIKKNSLDDPLLLQFVPKISENIDDGGLKDPVDDQRFQKTSSLLQKYNHRALIVTTSACAMHCRYCFRKNYPYIKSDFEDEIFAITQDSSITEVLLSGGDPLSLSDEKLGKLLEDLDQIPHLERIRFHTRFIIGIPERLHDGFLKKLQSISKQIIFVVHINHANELDDDIFQSLRRLLEIKIPVLTQTVLLKGVNDDFQTLFNLFNCLINQGIIPYYLHQFDEVKGAMHFEVDPEVGLQLIEKLQAHLPGYAVPKYVKEIPGRWSKTPLHSLECLNT